MKKVTSNKDNNFLDISLVSMRCGWLALRFQGKDVDITRDFDESLSDPLPDLVSSLSYVDSDDPFQFSLNHDVEVEFAVKPVDDDSVNIFIRIEDEERVIIDVNITKERYREIIGSLCTSILNSPDYPYQYFMYCDGFEEDDSIYELLDDMFNYLPEDIKDSSELYDRMYSVCLKHLGKKTEWGIECYENTNKMLRKAQKISNIADLDNSEQKRGGRYG